MIEIDFFSSLKTRKGSQRKELIEKFQTSKFQQSDFKEFGYDYFDNKNFGVGYSGYSYDGRYSKNVEHMICFYNLAKNSKVLELGCAKGFVLIEFLKQGMNVSGIDISEYAINNAMEEIYPFLQLGSSEHLNYATDSFDLVYSKEMLPHLNEDQIIATLNEAKRVCKTDNIFLEIQVGNNKKDCELIYQWDITHKCIKSSDWWCSFLKDCNFKGQFHLKPLFNSG